MSNLFHWLPEHPDFRSELAKIKQSISSADHQLQQIRNLANHNLDFRQINRIDNLMGKVAAEATSQANLRLAIVGSSTVEHLLPSIRVAALRRKVMVDVYIAPYGLYRQEILNPSSDLYQFVPDVVLMALGADALSVQLPLHSPMSVVQDSVQQQVEEWEHLWIVLSEQCSATIIQHLLVLPPETLFGQYDALLPASRNNILSEANSVLRKKARQRNVLLLDVDALASTIGKNNWCDPSLWHHAKQEISPAFAPLYGDAVSGLLAALRGLSYKCLVLDLDNTLWGGVIGDDGLEGIEIGQGNATGEAFLAFQNYVKSLKERGIILAVCSKNNEDNALEPFKLHPEMVLKQDDISCFVANWDDKATNIRQIASQLNIGLDSLVFFDDNPVERGIVRQYVPEIAVVEVPEDPANYVRCLASTGYFDAVSFSADDQVRTEQYIANRQRQTLKDTAHTIDSFLETLKMEMIVSPFEKLSIPRITQLINKSNQFNLTTRRYTQVQVEEMASDPTILDFQIRLSDKFGDNGLISVVIGKPSPDDPQSLHLDTWLMSCRVLGRQVEHEVLNSIAERAQKCGFNVLVGEYIKTAKNDMVKDLYERLGFTRIHEDSGNADHSLWYLALAEFVKTPTFINVK